MLTLQLKLPAGVTPKYARALLLWNLRTTPEQLVKQAVVDAQAEYDRRVAALNPGETMVFLFGRTLVKNSDGSTTEWDSD